MSDHNKKKAEVEKMLGHRMDAGERTIFDLMKDDVRYEFKKGANGLLEAHAIKEPAA